MASVASLEAENESLRKGIEEKRASLADTTLFATAQPVVRACEASLKDRGAMKGHVGKIYDMAWAPDSRHIVSAGQDGKLIIWDTFTKAKTHVFKLKSNWVMSCATAPGMGAVASGGLDNIVTTWRVREDESLVTEPEVELNAHKGFVTAIQYVSDEKILSASGDGSCILWDVARKTAVTTFQGHTEDVLSLHVNPQNKDLFITSGVDKTIRVWDVRVGSYVQTLLGHTEDVNTVKYFPDGSALASGDESGKLKLFSLRTTTEIGQYQHENISVGATSVCFSKSGRLLFGGYNNEMALAWDTLTGEWLFTLSAHLQRVTGVETSDDGVALCTCSWDTTLRVWTA